MAKPELAHWTLDSDCRSCQEWVQEVTLLWLCVESKQTAGPVPPGGQPTEVNQEGYLVGMGGSSGQSNRLVHTYV